MIELTRGCFPWYLKRFTLSPITARPTPMIGTQTAPPQHRGSNRRPVAAGPSAGLRLHTDSHRHAGDPTNRLLPSLPFAELTPDDQRIRRLFQLARFCTTGLACLIVSTATLVFVNDFTPFGYVFAYIVSFVTGNVLGYLINGRYTFRTALDSKGMLRYLGINVCNLTASTLLLRILVEKFHVWYVPAALSLAILSAPIIFTAHRLISYGKRPPVAAASQ